MIEITFTKAVEFPDNSTVEVTFRANVVQGGIGSYEFWGAKGCDSRLEWEDLACDTDNLTPPQVSWVNEWIEQGRFDGEANEALDNLPQM